MNSSHTSPGPGSPRSDSEISSDSEPHISEVATQDLHLHPRGDHERLNRELARQAVDQESLDLVGRNGEGLEVSHGSPETVALSVLDLEREVQLDLAVPLVTVPAITLNDVTIKAQSLPETYNLQAPD